MDEIIEERFHNQWIKYIEENQMLYKTLLESLALAELSFYSEKYLAWRVWP